MEGAPDAADPGPPPGALVVGVPPGGAERGVLARAAEDAVAAGIDGVAVVVVVEPPSFGWLWSPREGDADLGALREAVARRLTTGPVRVHVVEGSAAARLTDASVGAAGLYLGRARAGLPGPVALTCAVAARCPATVVPREETARPRGPVVVGLDDSACARTAVEHALEEGARSRRPVLVVSVVDGRPAGADDGVRRAVEVRSRATVHDLLARRARARRPAVTVAVEVREGSPVGVLCEVASRALASLLVLGARGRGRAGAPAAPTGAVATGVLLRASGAVRILRFDKGPRGR
ncbi:universal stress protein [Actinomycetospora sp. CA-101289]|uniref:universal stress protein n=1 Tax=Actinomycetospora sp. CA-101289 TaxID=3239893 RepID=UPI003D96F239